MEWNRNARIKVCFLAQGTTIFVITLRCYKFGCLSKVCGKAQDFLLKNYQLSAKFCRKGVFRPKWQFVEKEINLKSLSSSNEVK